jgi:tRNA(fMet)-specific endonuclease VapC
VLLLDTNAISALMMGEPGIADLLSEDDRHALPSIALGEYRYGLLRSRSRRQLEALLDTLVAASEVIGVDDETTRHYAAVRERLRAAGTPLPENDVWIAAIAVQHRFELASKDGHFDAVQGLTRRSW